MGAAVRGSKQQQGQVEMFLGFHGAGRTNDAQGSSQRSSPPINVTHATAVSSYPSILVSRTFCLVKNNINGDGLGRRKGDQEEATNGQTS
eukprot:1160604-Pelagomonas_calceolata.AAC.9